MQVTIDRISYPGTSVSAGKGKTILTDQGLPGETVRLRLIREKKNYILTETAEIICPSPDRIEPRCSHYRICSPYQYIEYACQCRIKEDQLKEMARRLTGGKSPLFPFHPSPLTWGYRNKIHLHLIEEKGRLSYAYHARHRDKEFIPIKKCFLVPPEINNFLQALLLSLSSAKIFFVREIIVRQCSGKKILAGLICGKNLDKELLERALKDLVKIFPLEGIILYDKTSAKEEVLQGTSFLEEQVLNTRFVLGIDSFFQVNIPVFEKMLSDLIEILSLKGSETLLDLYCGVGTIGLILAPRLKQVYSLESDKKNFVHTAASAKLNKIKNISFSSGKSETAAKALLAKKPDLVIVDPPRKGLDKKTRALICRYLPARLAYISCDPATLFRDLKEFLPFYGLKHISGYDFFPHTPHIECLAVLEKKGIAYSG